MNSHIKNQEPPRRDRNGYYKLDTGEKLLSVTTIKKFGIALDLTGWAGWEAGLLAMESIPALSRVRGAAKRQKMAYWLGQASERKKKEAGALGSAVHDMIECHILGQPSAEPTAEQKPFMDAFHQFLTIEQPTFEATEMVLAHPVDGWAGTADAFGILPNVGPQLMLLDWKSGASVHADFALQLAAYRRATVGWLKDGTKIIPPKTEGAVVVHIRPDKYEDTGYRIYPFDTSDAVYACFLSARQTAVDWVKGIEKTVMGEPYEPLVAVDNPDDVEVA